MDLVRAARRPTEGGAPLHMPWPSLADRGIILRRGLLGLVAAAPGVGKTTFMTNYAIFSKVPTLYISADTDTRTACERIAAASTFTPLSRTEAALRGGEEWPVAALRSLPWLRFAHSSDLTTAEIGGRVLAYREMEGDLPSLLVVDNLQDVEVGEDQLRGQGDLLQDMRALAGRSEMAVIVLHHATGQYDDGNVPIPQSGLRNKLSKEPALILTLHRGDATGNLFVSAVKNRQGPADPTGYGVQVRMMVDYGRNLIRDPRLNYNCPA